MNAKMELTWHNYKYYPYEKELALREVSALLGSQGAIGADGVVRMDSISSKAPADRLVYFAGIEQEGRSVPTTQSLLERASSLAGNKQSTRYSTHGLHEYKGKFNPQVAKALLNIFGIQSGERALDPFCGSGTSLVECAHLGVESVGMDINPMAVFLANAKLKALSIPAKRILSDGHRSLEAAKQSRARPRLSDERGEYLSAWFDEEYLRKVERLKVAIQETAGSSANVLFALASNLLRDYSLQEPHDLRIRRRKSAYPEMPFFDAYEKAVRVFCGRLESSQATLGTRSGNSVAIHMDCRVPSDHRELQRGSFDVALTSPPYATALPYIDTQRLSLVWLSLLPASDILSLEADLVGSREIRGQRKASLLEALEGNTAGIPDLELNFCRQLQMSLSATDGFRRQRVPQLLYRYFADMAKAFASIRPLMKPGARFGLIVGGNHTVLGGKRFDIDTPAHLASIAQEQSWIHEETLPLQTYQRFGLHANNATTTEALVVLRVASSPNR